jgi:hypothetical protein
MIFIYKPGTVLFWSVFWCGASGLLVWASIFHPPGHPGDHVSKWVVFAFGVVMFCLAAFRAVTAAKWVWRGFATFYTTVWRR